MSGIEKASDIFATRRRIDQHFVKQHCRLTLDYQRLESRGILTWLYQLALEIGSLP